MDAAEGAGADQLRLTSDGFRPRPGQLLARYTGCGQHKTTAAPLTRPAPMAAFARFSSSGASNDQAFQHDATPQSPKYITNATLRPSGEVTDRLGAPVRHRRGVRAAQQVSAMGPPGSRFA